MVLILEHPEVARRSCDDCQKFQYDDKGERVTWRGRDMERPAGTHPICRYGKDKCPKGTPENSKALSLKNRFAYYHYIECKATGQFPHDPIVRRNAAAIREVEDACERSFAARAMMAGTMSRVGGK